VSDGFVMRGAEARIYWSYLLVGTVGAWTVTRSSPDDPGTITATVQSVDSFRVSQRPLEFVVTHTHGVWRWPIETLQIDGAGLTARLRRKEVA
jgi:hypothetical protein